jgi:hypothetical protein
VPVGISVQDEVRLLSTLRREAEVVKQDGVKRRALGSFIEAGWTDLVGVDAGDI